MRTPKSLAMLTSLVVFAVMMIGNARGATYEGGVRVMREPSEVIPPLIPEATGDLQAVAFSAMCPNPIAPGAHPQSLTFSFANNGPTNLDAITYEFYLSRNATFGDSDDLLIGQYDEQFGPEGLYPGLFEDVSISTSNPSGMSWFTIPDTAAGTYYVFFRVVPADYSSVTEGNLANNVVCSTTAISVGVPACAYSVVATNTTFSENRGSLYVAVNAASDCVWATDRGKNDWVSFWPSSGVGPCWVEIYAEQNLTCQVRTARVTVAGETVVVTQAAGMGFYNLSWSNWLPSIAAQGTNVMVTANVSCGWSVVNPNPEWVTVSPSSGIGNGQVNIAVNFNDTGSPRSCTLTIAGKPFVITQGATCEYHLSFSFTEIHANGRNYATVSVQTCVGCTWSVTTSTDWLTAVPASGTGNGSVKIYASSNTTDTGRSAVVTVAGSDFTVNQAGLRIGPVTLLHPVNENVGCYGALFAWNAVADGKSLKDWYHLYFSKDGQGTEKWVQGTTWLNTDGFLPGNYTWWVQGWNTNGVGPWSDGSSFTVSKETPSIPIPQSPNRIPVSNPTVRYSWLGENATWYEISMTKDGQPFLDKWVEAKNIRVLVPPYDPGAFRPISELSLQGQDCGKYIWKVRAWSPDGMSDWSSLARFTNVYSIPGKITLFTPNNTVAVINDFYWKRDQTAEWYLVSIHRNGTNCFSQWVQATDSNIRTNLISSLPAGNYSWTVQGWNSKGLGPMSDAMSFTLLAPGTPISPVGIISNAFNCFRWSTQPGCTWYELYVIQDDALLCDEWKPVTSLYNYGDSSVVYCLDASFKYTGNYKWWVRGWSPVTGLSAWSATATCTATRTNGLHN